MILGLKGVVERHNERMIARGQDFLLGESSLDLVALDHLLLREDCPHVSTIIISKYVYGAHPS